MRNSGGVEPHPTPVKTTNPWRIYIALFAGSLTGGFIFAIGGALDGFASLVTITDYFRFFSEIAITSLQGMGLWFVGIIVFGTIPWWLLHKLGYAKWYMSILLGFSIPYIVIFISFSSTSFSLMFGLVGAAVGWVIWRVAYMKNGPHV